MEFMVIWFTFHRRSGSMQFGIKLVFRQSMNYNIIETNEENEWDKKIS
jgi:hypothetical protein